VFKEVKVFKVFKLYKLFISGGKGAASPLLTTHVFLDLGATAKRWGSVLGRKLRENARKCAVLLRFCRLFVSGEKTAKRVFFDQLRFSGFCPFTK
jgi:hypothetical protein